MDRWMDGWTDGRMGDGSVDGWASDSTMNTDNQFKELDWIPADITKHGREVESRKPNIKKSNNWKG